jgi:hypothetical protein
MPVIKIIFLRSCVLLVGLVLSGCYLYWVNHKLVPGEPELFIGTLRILDTRSIMSIKRQLGPEHADADMIGGFKIMPQGDNGPWVPMIPIEINQKFKYSLDGKVLKADNTKGSLESLAGSLVKCRRINYRCHDRQKICLVDISIQRIPQSF